MGDKPAPATAPAPAKTARASALSSFCDDDDDETAPPAPIVEPSVSDQIEGPTILFVADPETDRPVCGCLQS